MAFIINWSQERARLQKWFPLLTHRGAGNFDEKVDHYLFQNASDAEVALVPATSDAAEHKIFGSLYITATSRQKQISRITTDVTLWHTMSRIWHLIFVQPGLVR